MEQTRGFGEVSDRPRQAVSVASLAVLTQAALGRVSSHLRVGARVRRHSACNVFERITVKILKMKTVAQKGGV